MSDHNPVPAVDLSAIDSLAREIAQTIQREANINAVFGDAKQLDERKVIPVGQVSVVLGGGGGLGGGTAPKTKDKEGEPTTGFGGGGGGNLEIKIVPLGFIHEKEGNVVYSAIDHDTEGVVGRIEHLVRSTLKRGS